MTLCNELPQQIGVDALVAAIQEVPGHRNACTNGAEQNRPLIPGEAERAGPDRAEGNASSSIGKV